MITDWCSGFLALFCFVATTGNCYASNTKLTPEQEAKVRNNAIVINRALNERYLGVAASATAYDSALDALVATRARVEHNGDTLKADSVLSLCKAYDGVASACRECAKNAEQIDKTNWATTYSDEVAELKRMQTEDKFTNRDAVAERERLLQIKDRSIADDSNLHRAATVVEQTGIRLKIYDKSLDIYKRIDEMVKKNDDMISTYYIVFKNMADEYAQVATTLRTVYKYQRLIEIEKTTYRIIKQPERLLQTINALTDEWNGLRQEVLTIIGEK